MKARLLAATVILTVPAQSARAQSTDQVTRSVSSVIDALGGAIAQSRL